MRRGPLRHPWFAAFIGAFGLGAAADEVARLALPLLILDLTHDITAAATLRVVQSVPYILFGAPAGALIDRADKRRLLIACDAASLALTAAIPVSALAGLFSIQLLYVIGFLLGTVEVLWGVTTDFSVVPALVEEHELTEANGIFFGADRFARVIGPTLAASPSPRSGTSRRCGSRRSRSSRPSSSSTGCRRSTTRRASGRRSPWRTSRTRSPRGSVISGATACCGGSSS